MDEELEYEDFLESGAYVKKLEETYNRYLDARDKKLVEFMKENKRLRSIIKEVRECINKKLNINSDYVDYDFGTELLRQELLDILKGE